MSTQGHSQVATFDDFSQRLLDRFEIKDEDEYFKELVGLKQTGSINEYVEIFQKIAVMVPDMSKKRIVYLFLEGLEEPVKSLVKACAPSTLREAIKRSLQLEVSMPKKTMVWQPKPSNTWQQRGVFQKKVRSFPPPKNTPKANIPNIVPKKMDEVTRIELRWKGLCFICKESWVHGHRCLGKGQVHCIEIVPESDLDENEDFQDTYEEVGEEEDKEISKAVTIAALSGAPRYHPFRVRGFIAGQRTTILIDSGVAHNFLDEGYVLKRGLKTEEFLGFNVTVADGFTMPCTRIVRQLKITLGDYELCDDFYVVGIGDIDVVLGVQWLHSIGHYYTNHQIMEFKFQFNGKENLL